MTGSKLEKLIHSELFKPFRLLLVDGEEVTVKQPRKASVSGEQVALVGISRRRDGTSSEGFRIIRADRIVEVGPIDSGARQSG